MAAKTSPERQELERNMSPGRVGELWQDSGHEDGRLGVRDPDDEALAEDPARAARRGHGVDHAGQLPPVPDGLEAEEDQVGRAGGVPEHGRDGRPAPQGHAPADDEEHAGPGTTIRTNAVAANASREPVG